MAALFAGASRAVLASVVFAFEVTLQPMALLPLLAGCASAYLIATLLMRTSIMTEKLERRGVRVPTEYAADFLDQVRVRDFCTRDVRTLRTTELVSDLRPWLQSHQPGSTHQGFPVTRTDGSLQGVVTRRDLLDPEAAEIGTVGEILKRPPAVVFEDSTLREAADHMVREGVGRLPVVRRNDPMHVTGIITRSDLLSAHAGRLKETRFADEH